MAEIFITRKVFRAAIDILKIKGEILKKILNKH